MASATAGTAAIGVTVAGSVTAATARMLVKIPLLTYHAYNLGADRAWYDAATRAGSWCLYNMPRAAEVPVEFPVGVGLHRPGGGTGGWPYDLHNPDPFDATPRQTFVHWDGPFIAWLEGSGYTADYCTDVDLHRDGAALPVISSPPRVAAGLDALLVDTFAHCADFYAANLLIGNRRNVDIEKSSRPRRNANQVA